eukprot:4959830-Amphidinium_carterae.1
MKILGDQFGHIAREDCLEEPQPEAVSGHRLESGNTDYTAPSRTIDSGAGVPIGLVYGEVEGLVSGVIVTEPSIKILDAGWYAVCYCDLFCNEANNWAVYGRVLITGPNPNQEWV